ncbi:hypothetical protein K7X08_001070 [Anisodus acutangulus]|uniref:Scarecrow-like transcription factor PAT1 n=1 Tax=Anisodus acutangulus TaxID=402998 RepID=A0A9Q1MRK5_9SOLA|nr:hypothetical protein K7X08_001070 [Anisodus acutangulus]
MQASQRFSRSATSDAYCNQPVQKEEAYYFPQFQMLNNHSINRSQGDNHSIQTYSDRYCTLESFSPTGRYAVHNAASAVSFTPNGSPISHQESQSCLSDGHSNSPVSGSCITDDVNDFRHKLKELENVMLGPDSDILESCDNSLPSCITSPEIDCWRQMTEAIPRGDLKHVLIACAKAESDGDLLTAQWLISVLRQMVSVSGEPIQRLGAYILEELVARLATSGSSIYKSLRCKEPASFELLSYMHILHEVCPYFKFGYMSANGAIAEGMKDEQRVHIIDFQIAQGSRWVTLIQAFVDYNGCRKHEITRPGGPPYICITGIDDSTSAYARGGLNIVGKMFSKLAESFKVPFEFYAAAISCSEVQLENHRTRPGEALTVNFAFVLHHMPDESVSTENHRDRLIRLVKRLNPKVVTLVEQESNTNTAAFFLRFLETLDYYTTMFSSIDVTLPRAHKERINVEQHCLARDIVNIIACEGIERVERHELLEIWLLPVRGRRVERARDGFRSLCEPYVVRVAQTIYI